MRTTFRSSFARDLKKIKDRALLQEISSLIHEVEKAEGIQEIDNLKKLPGTTTFYRIRVGDYRVGITIQEDTIEFVRCLNRREIYRFFP